jgi:hypothetical protein
MPSRAMSLVRFKSRGIHVRDLTLPVERLRQIGIELVGRRQATHRQAALWISSIIIPHFGKILPSDRNPPQPLPAIGA